MPWVYLELPEALRLPPCPKCGNRGRVSHVGLCVYVCVDCQPAHAFAAEWRDERLVALVAPKERAG